MHSEYSVFLVLFPMLIEFHCENLSPVKSMFIFVLFLIPGTYFSYRGSTGWFISDFLVVKFIFKFLYSFLPLFGKPHL